MRTVFQVLKVMLVASSVILTTTDSFGQNSLPKNLKQAVRYLDKECPERVKSRILSVHEDSLKYAVYPFAKAEPYKDYKTVFHWTSDENGNPKITRYLKSKGVYEDHSEVLLYSFRQYLLNGQINEKEILRKFVAIQGESEAREKIKFEADRIDGIYIPESLEDCFTQIDSFWDDSVKLEVRRWDENEFVAKTSFGFGMWIRNNWRLWGGSRLSKYFNDLGIYHPDDMSGIILVSYHRHLNNRDIDLPGQVKCYHVYWENVNTAELSRRQEEFSEYNVGDTLEFNYNKGFVSDEQEEKFYDNVCIARGIVSGLDEKRFLIKVRIINTCDKKGIIFYDNEGEKIYDPVSGRLSNPPKRIVKKVKANREQWFEYSDWETL